MKSDREKLQSSGALLALHEDLAGHEQCLLKIARRVDSLEAVLAGIVTAPAGPRVKENRVLILSTLQLGLIVAGVFVAGIVSAVATFAWLSS